MNIVRTVHPSALGNLLIEANEIGLTRVAFTGEAVGAEGAAPQLRTAATQLDEYLAGTRRDFTVPLDWAAVSAFDQRVLRTLDETVRYGETASYGALTRRLGCPPADARKIGGALARNRFLILLPCHRVLGADGSLTGYAGGLPAKRALLDLESALESGNAMLPLAI